MKLILPLLLFAVSLSAQPVLDLVPYPAEVKIEQGVYRIKPTVKIYSTFKNTFLLSYLKNELKKINIKADEIKDEHSADISLFATRMPSGGSIAYRLITGKNGIRINANFDESAFYGIQTLIQLVEKKAIPFSTIYDYPRYQHRGMHLDVCRHFFPVSYIKRYIDFLAFHKMNSFHWHLSDDQGWRIEIKKYPKLTSVGAWRNGTIKGRYPGTGNDNRLYGGFYTQEQIKEIVAYAKARFINVIPEIEMPAHSCAAIAAYPELSCFPDKPSFIPAKMISEKSKTEQSKGRIKLVQETWGSFEDVICPGKESTYEFLENVLSEVIALFPSKYIHMGGDECIKTNWKTCPDCQQRKKANNLESEAELQSYFVRRIEKYLNSKGKVLVGWDEILEGGLAPNAVVMSWRGEKGGIEASQLGHDVIMSPGDPVYFDHTQSINEDSVTFGGYNPIEKVYAYEPTPAILSPEKAKHILGAQANVWTEYMSNKNKVEYMIFPRMSALSEVLWSPKEQRDWKRFELRIPGLLDRYKKWGASYSVAYYDLQTLVIPSPDSVATVSWTLLSRDKNAKIFWKTSASGEEVPYREPITVTNNTELQAWSVTGGKTSSVIRQKFQVNKATGKNIRLKEQASSNYPGDGAFTLVNGVINEKALGRSREFLGFLGKDMEAVIDLGDIRLVSFVVINALNQRPSWIWQPRSAEIMGSSDGKTFYPIASTESFNESKDGKGTMILAFRATPVQYVKILVKNWGKIPDGNPGAGSPAWLFIDEIEIDGPED